MKTTYLCELVNDGIVQERFYRDGTSREEVKDGLEMFQWPEGEWKIQVVENVCRGAASR